MERRQKRRGNVVAICALALIFLALVLWLFVRRPSSLLSVAALVVIASAALACIALVLPLEARKAAAGFAGAFVACAALIAALLAIPSTSGDSQEMNAAKEKRQVPRFSGVVGNFEQSRAFLEFLSDNDGQPVQLDRVGFNEAAFEDDWTTEVDSEGITRVVYVHIFHECTPPIADDEQPTFAKGCLATSFSIVGKQTDDAHGYLTHGVPVYNGFFRVDITGVLHMGVYSTRLETMTREAATTG